MRRPLVLLPVLVSLVALPALAGDGEPKRDPEGVKGISPYNEHVAAGRKASASGDYDGAITALDAAIADNEAKMLAYLLKAQCLLAKGDLDGAAQQVETGRSKQGTEEQQSKLLFLAADLKERKAAPPTKKEVGKESTLSEALQSSWDKVTEAWSAYSAFVASHTRVPDYTATSTERKKKVEDRVQREKDYGAVAERVRKNAEQAQKDAEADAARNEKEK